MPSGSGAIVTSPNTSLAGTWPALSGDATSHMRFARQVPDPTLQDLYEALTAPHVARLSPDMAAAHALASGADGPALRELAALSDRDFERALELVPTAYEEAAQLLSQVHAGRSDRDAVEGRAGTTLIIAWATAEIAERIDVVEAFLAGLSQQAASLGVGEVEGPVDEADEQVAYCYGDDIDALRTFISARLVEAPIPHSRLALRT